MATSESNDLDSEQGHDPGHLTHRIDPLWLYLAVFGGLLVMTAITVGASYIDFGSANIVIAVLIASVKASLVALFFMQLRHDKLFHSIIFSAGILFLALLFFFTIGDDNTRNQVDDMHGKPTFKAAPARH